MPSLQFAPPTAEDSPVPADRWFLAELVAVTEKQHHKKNGETFQKWSWKFVIDDPDGPFDGRFVFGDTGSSGSGYDSKRIYTWACELYSTELPWDFALDTDLLLGKRVRLKTGQRSYEKNGEQKFATFVSELRRLDA